MANTLEQPEVDPGTHTAGYESLTAPAEQLNEHGIVSEEARRLAEHQRTELARQLQALNLQRENILSQKTSNPARRAALENALEQIESEIKALA